MKNEVPEGWSISTIGAISNEFYRYPTYYDIQYVEQGVREIRGELIQDDGSINKNSEIQRYISERTCARFPRTILREGDFVISVRGTMGKIGYIDKDLAGSNMTANLMRISPNRKKVYPKWLKQYLLSNLFQFELDFISSATTIKTIKSPELKAIRVILPRYEEQKKIAAILQSADNAIDKTKELIEKHKKMKQGLMVDLFEPRKDWEEKTLNQVIRIKHGFAFQGEFFSDEPNKNILLTPGNFHIDGGLYFTKDNTKYYTGSFPFEFILKNGDLLIVMTDLTKEMNILGNVVLLNHNLNILHNQRIGKIIIRNSSLISRDYLLYFMNSDFVRKGIKETATGTTVRHTSPDRILSNKITYPKLLKEQERLSKILLSINTKIISEQSYLDKLIKMKAGLMQDLLTGRTLVKVGG